MKKSSLNLSWVAVAMTSALALGACSGELVDPRGDPRGGGSAGGEPSPGSDAVPEPGAFVPESATLRRLTAAQYRNTLLDLFGEGVTLPADLEQDTLLHGSSSIGAARVALSARGTELFEAAALAITEQVFGDAARRRAVTGCDATEPDCTRRFVTSFGRRVFRRPLAADEVERYTAVGEAAASALNDAWSGPRYAALGLLQSPYFLYRVELGVADPEDPNRRVFGGYEAASRLSYFLWDTTPDLELLGAAERGELDSEAGLVAQAERLLGAPRAERTVEAFFGELFRVDKLTDLAQLPSAFPQVTPTLGAALREEVLRFFGDLMQRDGSYRSIFETRTTFVDAELAALYGIAAPAGAGFAQVTLPASGPRAGILGLAGFLANNAHASSSSPTLRGKFIREVLLCQAIPPPPPDVVTDLAVSVGTEPRTMREKLAVHAQNPTCAACHQAMDPIGLGLENFDGIGAFRAEDAGKTIDASGELDGVAFRDAVELGSVLARHPALTECLARSVYRKAVGHLENDDEQRLLGTLARQADEGGARLRALLLSIVRSAGFRYTTATVE